MGMWPQQKQTKTALPSENVWRALEKYGRASIAQLRRATYESGQDIRKMLVRWMAQGAVRLCDDAGGAQIFEMTTSDLPQHTRVTSQQRMWKAMRVAASFDAAELGYLAQVATSTAKRYIGALNRTGYLKTVRQARKSGVRAAYKLARWTGQEAPKILTGKQVWDSNEKRIVPTVSKSVKGDE